jgi:diaminohydroxyphosphoribosylaminopyrimidine deaminase/5-amino-6-(5-phosphoribosylamino)uracil reductase
LSTHLLEALVLAQQRRGFCAPNPAVGAVVVKEGMVIASGNHWAAGQSHAE